MKVVSNTSPINYLILIDAADVFELMYAEIRIPLAVQSELGHPSAPAKVRNFISSPPSWLHISPAPPATSGLSHLDPGEAEAISLAEMIGADALLMDDRAGTITARERSLTTIGTLGVLHRAAQRGYVDLRRCVEHLNRTTFRMPAWLVRRLLSQSEG